MSNLFKYTKRVLTSVLAATLIVTALPVGAMGAELVDEDITIDAQGTDVVEMAEETEGVVESDDLVADAVSEDEEGDAFESTDDVAITFTKADDNIDIFDPDSINGEAALVSPVNWDSTRDFTMTLTAKNGYVIKSDSDVTVKWTNDIDDAEAWRSVTKSSSGYGYTVAADGSSATVTVYSPVLVDYKSNMNDTPEKNQFKIEIAAGKAEADKYTVSTVNTLTVPAADLEVTYGQDDKEINLKEYQKYGSPITGVSVYTNYGTDAQRKLEGSDYYTFATVTKIVTLKDDAVNAGYEAGKSLTIVAESKQFSVSQTADPNGTVLGFTQNDVETDELKHGYSTDYTHDLVASIKSAPDGVVGRTLSTAKALVTYDDASETTEEKPMEVDGADATLAAENFVNAKSIVVTVTTAEAVNKTAKVENATVTAPATIETGKELKFSVKASDGYTFDDEAAVVGYILGEVTASSIPTKLAITADGNYVIPASATKNQITIVATAVAKEQNTTVKLANVDFTVKDRDTQVGLTTGGASLATIGKPYYFIVSPAASQSVKEVTYTIGAGTEKYTATKTSTENVYMIPASREEGAITITVEGYVMVPVVVPTNTKAVVWVGNEAKKTNFYVRKDQDFTFTLKGSAKETDGAITFNEVKTVVAGGASETKTLNNVPTYTATIKADEITGGITIDAKTKEVAKAGTYSFAFTADTSSNFGWEDKNKNPEDGDEFEVMTSKPGFETLFIGSTDTATLTPTLTVGVSTVSLTGLGADDVSFETKSGKDTIFGVEKDGTDPENPVIATETQGSDSVLYSYTVADAVNTGNVITYSGELEVSSVPHYTVTLGTYSVDGLALVNPYLVSDKEGFAGRTGSATIATYAADWNVGSKRLNVAAKVYNAVKRIVEVSADDLTEAEITWTGADSVFFVTRGDKTNKSGAEEPKGDALNAIVAAKDVGTGSFNVVISEAGYTYTAATPASFASIEAGEFTVIPTVTVKNGAEFFVNAANTITLDAATLKEATLSYKVYKQLKAFDLVVTDIDSPENVIVALEKGYVEDVTSDVDFEMSYYTGTKPSYITIDGSNGTYKATVTGKGGDVNVKVTATINHQKVENNNVTIESLASAGKAKIPFATNDGDKVVTLPSSYLAGKDYTIGYVKAEPTDGYQFKVVKGTEFVLPTEVEGLDAKKTLVGWAITAPAGAVHGEDDLAATAYLPGQKLVVDGDITKIEPEYVDGYDFDANPMFRNTGKTVEDNVTTWTLTDNGYDYKSEVEEVEVPDPSAVINDSDNNEFSVYAEGDELIDLGLQVVKFTQAPDAGGQPNEIYPEAAASKTNGKVVWKAYDTDYTPAVVWPADNAEKRAALDAACDAVTVVDKTALGKGQIKGLVAGKTAQLFAFYYDEKGNEYVTDDTVEIAVSARPAYSVDFEADFPTEIAVGQFIDSTATNGLLVSKSGSAIVDPESIGSITWEVSGSGEVELKESSNPTFTGVKAGTVKVKAVFTDNNGVTVKSEEKTINVIASPYSINIVDKDGAAFTGVPEVAVGSTNTNLYFTVTKTSGGSYVTDGTFAITNNEATPATYATATYENVVGNTNIKHVVLGGSAVKAGEDKFTISYTADGNTYTKEVSMKSFYTLTFDAAQAKVVTGTAGEVEPAKVKVNGTGGEAVGNNYVIKLYAEDLDKDGKFSLDLTQFTATYSGTNPVDFAGWTGTDGVATTLANVVTKLENEVAGNKSVAPQFKDIAVASINTSSSSIVINNLDETIEKTIEVSASPKSGAKVFATAGVNLADETDGFFLLNDGTVSPLQLIATPADNVNKYTFKVKAKANMVGDSKVTISAVGSDVTKDVTVKIYGQYGADKKYRKADGTDAVDTAVTVNNKTRFYDKDGALIATAGAAHDAEGNLVLLKDAEAPADYATLDTTDGYRAAIAGFDYYTKNGIVQTGLLKAEVTGQLVDLYADKGTGAIVTYAMTEKAKTPGQWTDTVDGAVYNIENGTNKAELSDILYAPTVAWTTPFPTKWSKTEPIPKVAYTVTYKSALTGKEATTDPIDAEVTSAPWASDATEITFTATADLSKYYKDKEGKEKVENATVEHTYRFRNGGSESESGQPVDPEGNIVIEGVAEAYPWTGKQIKPSFKVFDNTTGKYLAKDTDYSVKYGKNKDAGAKNGTITVSGKGNYTGTGTTAFFDIKIPEVPADPAGEVKKVNKPAKQDYTGDPIYPDTIVVDLVSGSKVTMHHDGDGVYSNADPSGKELLVEVTNNVDKGAATVAVTGANNVTKTANFDIKAVSIANAMAIGEDNPFFVTISPADYLTKATKPEVSIKYYDKELIENQDYKMTVDAKKKEIKVTGKNNFTKNFTASLTVNALDLDDCTMILTKGCNGGKKKEVKVVVLDPNGDVVPANNYTLTVDGSDVLGDVVTVKAVANTSKNPNLLSGSELEETFELGTNDFSRVSIKANASVVYTGEAIDLEDLDPEWIEKNVVVKKGNTTLKFGDDFEITGYTASVKKGQMTVYASGKGDWSGSKNFKVKITAKPFN